MLSNRPLLYFYRGKNNSLNHRDTVNNVWIVNSESSSHNKARQKKLPREHRRLSKFGLLGQTQISPMSPRST